MSNAPAVVKHRRPRRVLSALIRDRLKCPGCQGAVRVVRFREKACRLECAVCELRFSVAPSALAEATFKHVEAYVGQRDIVGAMLDAPELLEFVKSGDEQGGMAVVYARIREEAVALVKEAQSPGRLKGLIEGQP